jgi:tryptophan synthase alpha chain
VERYDQKRGADAFIRDAAAAGVDGVLIVDYPPEECVAFAEKLRAKQMDLIFLLAPTSTEQRMQQIAQVASGYVYYVSLKGVTGSGTLDTAAVEAMLPRIRKHVNVPVGVGFGIRDAATAQAIGRVADAVVIGSKIIQLIESQPRDAVVSTAADFLRGIRSALDA